MAKIKKVEFSYKKAHLNRDPKTGKWYGYQIDVRDGKKRRRDVFSSKKAAEEFIDAILKKRVYTRAGVQLESNRNITVGQLFDARVDSITSRKQREIESRTRDYFLQVVNPFTPVTSLTVDHLREYVKKRSNDTTPRGTIINPQTVDRELNIIAATLHNAGEYFDELANYIAPRIPRPKYRKGRRERVVTDDERNAILAELYKAKPAFARIFEIASLTGIRHSEAMGLLKTDLNARARSLRVYRPKTDTVSTISPLTDRMLELLSNNEFKGPYIFTSNGKTPGTFYRYLKAACEAAGVTYGRYVQGGVVLHDLRHSFITKLHQEGTDIATIQSFTGQADKTIVMRYSHAGPESRRRAMAIIDGKNGSDKLRKLYDEIRSGRMSFEDFLAALK
jgi:integrase